MFDSSARPGAGKSSSGESSEIVMAEARPGHDQDDVYEILRQRFGLLAFRPGQAEVIAALREHRAALAVFPTGGGKSL